MGLKSRYGRTVSLEVVGQTHFTSLFQFLEAACIPWLVPLTSRALIIIFLSLNVTLLPSSNMESYDCIVPTQIIQENLNLIIPADHFAVLGNMYTELGD